MSAFYEGQENIDEKITAQKEAIEKEIAKEQPLVSIKLPTQILLDEYSPEDSVYIKKINDLCENFSCIRKTRGDGNCFFRAFGFSYLETLIGKKDEIESLKAKVEKILSDLTSLGYNSFTVEDFKDVFVEVLNKLTEENMNSEGLEKIFCDSGLSDYIVVFLRLIVSCYLQMNSDFFISFIENYATMKDFCGHEVEPMYRESDHIHIIALTNALNIPVSIIYLDRGEQDKVMAHNFPEDSSPVIHMLYRPGHYDVIYK